MFIGDIVVPKPGSSKVLHCATSIYENAVVGFLDPFVLVSQSGDMVWSVSWEPEELEVIGTASLAVQDVVRKRLQKTKEHLR
jgi:hypothetical protein